MQGHIVYDTKKEPTYWYRQFDYFCVRACGRVKEQRGIIDWIINPSLPGEVQVYVRAQKF